MIFGKKSSCTHKQLPAPFQPSQLHGEKKYINTQKCKNTQCAGAKKVSFTACHSGTL